MNCYLYFSIFCWLVFSLVTLLRFAHVLQAERYHTDAYIKWVLYGGAVTVYSQKKYDKPFHLISITLATIICFLPHSIEINSYLLSAGAIVWLWFHVRVKSGVKKKFVATARVKRLLLITIIVEAIYLTFMRSYGDTILLSQTVILGYFQPFFLALGNSLAKPIETFLQSGFKRKAREKLGDRKVIAVTGSYGKTGTKEAIAHLLETTYPLLKTPGSFNTPMGLCKVINNGLEEHHELFVTEMGATKKGDIKELCQIVSPSIAVITSIGEAHLETFGTIKNVAKTKFELADSLSPEGVLIINSDHPLAEKMAEGRKQKMVRYGFGEGADFRPANIRCSSKGSVFDLITPSGKIENINIRLLGKLNVINVTAGFAVGTELGIPTTKLINGAGSLRQMESRLELIANSGSYLIINDGFNSNPIGAVSAVETLSYFEGMKKIMVTPGIVDVGEEHDRINFEFGRISAKQCDYVLLINERRTASLKNGLLAGGMNMDRVTVFPSLEKARVYLNKIADDKAVVLFENDLPDHMEEF